MAKVRPIVALSLFDSGPAATHGMPNPIHPTVPATLAWSPDGSLLAVARGDSLLVFRRRDLASTAQMLRDAPGSDDDQETATRKDS